MANAHLPTRLAEWLRDRHGVVTTQALRTFDVGRKAQARLIDAGLLRSAARGVFVSTTASATLEHRCALVCAAHPHGFITGPTAGALAGLRRQPPASIQFASLHGRHLEPLPGVRFRQTTKIRPADRWRRDDGITVASWTRLAFDLAGDLAPLDHRSVVHQLLDRRLVTADELTATARRLCHPARRGSETFRRTVESLGDAAHDSHPEVALGEALRARGVPVEPQVPVATVDGITVHVDLGVAAARWGVEVDVHPGHRGVEGHHRDSRRVRGLHRRDWVIEPVAELDLKDLAGVADELAELYRQQLRLHRQSEC